MTAPVPSGPRDNTGQEREELARVLHQGHDMGGDVADCLFCWDDADAVLPLIDRIATARGITRVQEALRAAADVLDDQARSCDDEDDERGRSAYAWAAATVRARADALGQP